MTGHSDDPAELRARIVDRLLAGDGMAIWSVAVAPWRSALATVPRHEFIPDTVWIKNPSHWPTLLPLCRDDDPQDCAVTHFAALMPETPDFVAALHRINDVALKC